MEVITIKEVYIKIGELPQIYKVGEDCDGGLVSAIKEVTGGVKIYVDGKLYALYRSLNYAVYY